MKVSTDPRLKSKFSNYPPKVRKRMKHLRKLILEEARSLDHVHELEETLKWGEPSYLVKKGSTIRMDWKEKNPDQYALYFKCTSKLVPTFRAVYGDLFIYEKTRALLFPIDEELGLEKEVRSCIRMALSYHLIKDQPLLGHELDGLSD